MPAATTIDEQVIEIAGVTGPDGADRLLTCTGQAVVAMAVGSNQNMHEVWTFLVGPPLPHPQFHRAMASVSVAAYATYIDSQFDPTTNMPIVTNAWHNLDFRSVEADWDDESGKTEMRVDVGIATGAVYFTLAKIGYTATVLAESA